MGANTGTRKRVAIALSVIALLAGVALVAYPAVSDYVSKLNQLSIVQKQDAAVGQQLGAALATEMRASREYNERLLNNRTVVSDPFDPSNQPVSTQEYIERDNIAADGVMGTLVIPKIKVAVPVYHGTGEEALQRGAGHLEATSLPVGGESTHAVLAGHNGLPSARMFDDLHELEIGDYFVMEVLGEDHAYRVTSIETVFPEETDSLIVQEGKDLMTLITCTPYGINTHRLLVHAERCPLPDAWRAGDKDAAQDVVPPVSSFLMPLTLLGVALGAGILIAHGVLARSRAVRVTPSKLAPRHSKDTSHV